MQQTLKSNLVAGDLNQSRTVNDIHSKLNRTFMRNVLLPDSLEACTHAISYEESVIAAGGFHAMGGQQFCENRTLVRTDKMNRVLSLDRSTGIIEVESGIQWPAISDYLLDPRNRAEHFAIRQKQTGADNFSIGGSLSANIHGRGLNLRPFIDDIESFTLVNPSGEIQNCSRSENADLFALAIGGYGLFGFVYSVKLRLDVRRTLRRDVAIVHLEDLIHSIDNRVSAGALYGDFQFCTDEKSDDFLARGVFATYTPVDRIERHRQSSAHLELGASNWERLLWLAHHDKAAAYREYCQFYLATSGQLYDSERHQFSVYLENYHAQLDAHLGRDCTSTEMITEVYVPRNRLVSFMAKTASYFRESSADLIYGTVRFIQKDTESVLAWASQDWACIVFNLCVQHSDVGLKRAADHFRTLIDLAIEEGGSYYLTYHRFASVQQVETCYPRFREFLRAKAIRDPENKFQSDWYRHYARLFSGANQ
ncbi:MAG: FAD-binding oxidoreductase [Leptospirales bacterium]|nr:FAD-binding oxidoreductase [Leptospirales bacterium]